MAFGNLPSRPSEIPFVRDGGRGKPLPLPVDMSAGELSDFIMQDISDAPRRGVTEAAAKKLIQSEFGVISPVINAKNRESTVISIQRLSEKGISIRQLSRLTGISKSIIERA